VEGRRRVGRSEYCPDPSVFVAKECVGLAVVAFPSSSSFAGWLRWNPRRGSQNAGSSRVVVATGPHRRLVRIMDLSYLEMHLAWKIHVRRFERNNEV
jgi:hypothetical protein